MRKELAYTTRALLLAAVAAQAACTKYTQNPEVLTPLSPTPITTLPTEVPAQVLPTKSPDIIIINTPIQTPVEKQGAARYEVGGMNFAKSPFKIKESGDFRKFLGHIFGKDFYFYADVPYPVVKAVDETQQASKEFEDAGKRVGDNPYLLYLTDQPNHIVLYSHSEQITHATPGEFSREIVSWWYRNPDKAKDLYKQKIQIEIDGRLVDAKIVNATFISADTWEGNDPNNNPWQLSGENLVVSTQALGIPQNIRTDKSPKKYFITIVGCINKNPGDITSPHPKLPGIPEVTPAQAYALNTANRSILTLEIDLP